MTRVTIISIASAALAVGAIAALVFTRLNSAEPDPVVDLPYECTTCDARQAAKKRLSDHLRSKAE